MYLWNGIRLGVVVMNYRVSLYRDQATGWTTGVWFPAGVRWNFCSSPPRPDLFWGPFSLLSNGYRVLFFRE